MNTMNRRTFTLAVIAAGITASVTVNAGSATIAGVGDNRFVPLSFVQPITAY